MDLLLTSSVDARAVREAHTNDHLQLSGWTQLDLFTQNGSVAGATSSGPFLWKRRSGLSHFVYLRKGPKTCSLRAKRSL